MTVKIVSTDRITLVLMVCVDWHWCCRTFLPNLQSRSYLQRRLKWRWCATRCRQLARLSGREPNPWTLRLAQQGGWISPAAISWRKEMCVCLSFSTISPFASACISSASWSWGGRSGALTGLSITKLWRPISLIIRRIESTKLSKLIIHHSQLAIWRTNAMRHPKCAILYLNSTNKLQNADIDIFLWSQYIPLQWSKSLLSTLTLSRKTSSHLLNLDLFLFASFLMHLLLSKLKKPPSIENANLCIPLKHQLIASLHFTNDVKNGHKLCETRKSTS